jgi:hypothetical protein
MAIYVTSEGEIHRTPPHDEHPCRSANYSPCRANSGLSPPSHLTANMRIRTAPTMGATRHTWRTKENPQQGMLVGGLFYCLFIRRLMC